MNWGWKCEARNDKVAKYHSFTDSSGKVITYAEFVNFLRQKDKDFLQSFIRSLNNATKEFGAYFWECPPVINETITKKFEFVVIKSEELNKIKENQTPFVENMTDANIAGKGAASFPNLNKNAILVVPIKKASSEKEALLIDYKNLSAFTKNSPFEHQQEFWKEVGDKLAESLRNSREPKWLSTHGLGVPYLHVRIDSKSKYYSCEEYKNLGGNNKQTTNIKIAKEKIFRNLDKICLDPNGSLANSELLKRVDAESYYKKGKSHTHIWEEWAKDAYKVEIEGEKIDLEKFELPDLAEIKEALINEIKQNPAEWKIEEGKEKHLKRFNWFVRHKSGRRHWKIGFTMGTKGKKDWAKIEARIKNTNSNQSPSQSNQNNNKSGNFANMKDAKKKQNANKKGERSRSIFPLIIFLVLLISLLFTFIILIIKSHLRSIKKTNKLSVKKKK